MIEGDYTMAPSIEGTWFIDPPYQVKGSCYVHGSKAIDFDKLAVWCKERVGQVVVCENAGATWLPFKSFGVATRRRAKPGENTFNEEVVWMK